MKSKSVNLRQMHSLLVALACASVLASCGVRIKTKSDGDTNQQERDSKSDQPNPSDASSNGGGSGGDSSAMQNYLPGLGDRSYVLTGVCTVGSAQFSLSLVGKSFTLSRSTDDGSTIGSDSGDLKLENNSMTLVDSHIVSRTLATCAINNARQKIAGQEVSRFLTCTLSEHSSVKFFSHCDSINFRR